MNNDLSELVFILDMSGSMRPLRKDTIGGYNSLLEKQKNEEGDANITTVLFDDQYILLHDRVDIKEVENITEKEYSPRGMTAMLDAVGRTISSINQRIQAMPKDKCPGNVVVTIITDGYENASKEYTWESIQSMIKEQKSKYDWIFTFIGANIDTKKVSESMGIEANLARNYTASKKGTNSVFYSMSKSISSSRKGVCENKSYNERVEKISKSMDNIE